MGAIPRGRGHPQSGDASAFGAMKLEETAVSSAEDEPRGPVASTLGSARRRRTLRIPAYELDSLAEVTSHPTSDAHRPSIERKSGLPQPHAPSVLQ
ncbi:hypothetical protein VTO73DRAFT_11430 [Trametes versicolor]